MVMVIFLMNLHTVNTTVTPLPPGAVHFSMQVRADLDIIVPP